MGRAAHAQPARGKSLLSPKREGTSPKREASPDAVAGGSAEPVESAEGGEEEEPAVDLAVSDASSEGFADLDAVPGCASPAPLLASSASSLAAAVRPGAPRRAEGPSAVLAPLAMTAMFLFVSIPMIEKRSLERRTNYQQVIDETSMLIPWPPRKQRAGESSA